LAFLNTEGNSYFHLPKTLTNTTQYFSTADAEKAPEFLAQGYIYNQPKDTYHPVPAMDLRITSGAGAVVSNVLDYTKWLKAFLSLSGPISKEGHTELRKARTLIDQVSLFATKDSPYTGPQAYCLGWFTGVYKGYEYFEHAGGMEAFGADVLFFPALNYGLVSFGNTAMTANAVEQKLIWHLVDEKLGTPKDERFDWDKKYGPYYVLRGK
jgi:CubicO group peptidase (beta-lactamase class C family)